MAKLLNFPEAAIPERARSGIALVLSAASEVVQWRFIRGVKRDFLELGWSRYDG